MPLFIALLLLSVTFFIPTALTPDIVSPGQVTPMTPDDVAFPEPLVSADMTELTGDLFTDVVSCAADPILTAQAYCSPACRQCRNYCQNQRGNCRADCTGDFGDESDAPRTGRCNRKCDRAFRSCMTGCQNE